MEKPRRGIATCLHNLGGVYLMLQRYDGAEHVLQESLSQRRAVGDVSGEAHGLNNLSAVALRRGDLVAADQHGMRLSQISE